MSNSESAYGGAESAHGGAAAQNPPTAARWARPVLIMIMALCGLVLLGRFVGEPLMTIRHITVHSDVPLADDQVLQLSGIRGGEHWYTVSEAAIRGRLEASPLIRRALVERVFPDTIRMTLWGRQPAALVLAAADGRILPVLVDEDGVAFKVGTTSADLDLPVVSGLSAGDMSLGAQLPRAYRALFAELRAMREKAPAMCAAVSEVRVVGGSSADLSPQDLDLIVYLTSSPVPIRARGSLDESLVKYALMATDLLSRQGVLKDIQELDFRGGDLVYKLAGRNAPGAKSAEYRDSAAGTKGG
ncbi:MAG: FtsQ-type POTRA domain-containing protein [Spirochaetia bacterium]